MKAYFVSPSPMREFKASAVAKEAAAEIGLGIFALVKLRIKERNAWATAMSTSRTRGLDGRHSQS